MRIAVVLLLFGSFAHGVACPTGQMKNQAALVQIEQVWLKAEDQHDVAALACILADEFEEADFNGSVIDRTTMLANASKPSSSNIRFELSELNAHIYGDTAYVRGIGTGSGNGRQAIKNRFTDIFIYRDGRWQCVAGHESRFPKVQR